jgi:hypothetical protein
MELASGELHTQARDQLETPTVAPKFWFHEAPAFVVCYVLRENEILRRLLPWVALEKRTR